MIEANEPTPVEQYFDEQGNITYDGLQYFQRIIRTLKDLDSRLEALEP